MGTERTKTAHALILLGNIPVTFVNTLTIGLYRAKDNNQYVYLLELYGSTFKLAPCRGAR
jgi:hypothetical protein